MREGIMKINELNNGQAKHFEQAYKRTVRLCKAIYDNYDYIVQIKDCLNTGDLTGASQLFHELSIEDQKLLLIAPTFGGPFMTGERGILKNLWEIKADELY